MTHNDRERDWDTASEVLQLLSNRSGNFRNKFLRKTSLVEYRCKRGCLLLAVIEFKRARLVVREDHLESMGDDVSSYDILGIEGNVPEVLERLPSGIVEQVRDELRFVDADSLVNELEWGELHLEPRSLREQISMGLNHEEVGGGLLAVETWGASGHYHPDIGSYHRSNCRHVDLSRPDSKIEADIHRLKGEKKKTVYLQ